MTNKNLNIKVTKLNAVYIFIALTLAFTLIYLGETGKVSWLKEITDFAYGDILIIFILGEVFHIVHSIHVNLFNKRHAV